ncbi:MAG TPA: zinc transporter ZupT [Bacteroidetes bacterium]|nr:zinc transporter ZupT [Bacteroidota bacterium]HRK05828.1 zinc transporter ZupT [Chlorobiota bacterium]
MDFHVLGFAFGLTLFAGLATGVGSAMAFFAKRTSTRFLSVSLGFSAGVMIYVSFVEILNKSITDLSVTYGPTEGKWYAVMSFFLGILIIAAIDKLVPSYENPHENMSVEFMDDKDREEEFRRRGTLLRTGLFTALAIGIHNFPEGLATFVSAIDNPKLGLAIAIAIAIHNIPEGIAVSVPVFYATHDRKKAFLWSFLSGLAEPVGAIVGYLLLLPIMSTTVMGVLFGMVAGIMVFISLDELLPAARAYGEHHLSVYGLVAGMAVMAVSLLLLL